MKAVTLTQENVYTTLFLFILRLFMGLTFIMVAFIEIIHFGDCVSMGKTMNFSRPELNVSALILIEAIGGLMLIFGLFSRATSVILIFALLLGMFMISVQEVVFSTTFGIELNIAYAIILLIIATFGSGKFSLDESVLSKS